MVWVKFGGNWPFTSREIKRFELRKCICANLLFSPVGKGWDSSYEQARIFFTQGCCVPSVTEIGSVVIRKRRFLKVDNFFFLYSSYLPMGKGVGLYLNKLDFQSPRNSLCQVW